MLPLRDANPTERVAVVTLALIGLNIAVFLFEPLRGSDLAQARFFYCHAAIPAEVTHGHALSLMSRLGCPNKNVYLSVITSMFLHGGLLHIGGNMLFLWIFGNNVEDRLGRVKYIIFYLLCGFAATLAQTLLNGNSTTPLIGASGAIAGVLGAYLIMFPRARILTFFGFFLIEVPAVVVLAGWFVMQIFQGVGSVTGRPADNVAYFAHIGGFVAGMALLLVLRPRRPQAPPGPFGLAG